MFEDSLEHCTFEGTILLFQYQKGEQVSIYFFIFSKYSSNILSMTRTGEGRLMLCVVGINHYPLKSLGDSVLQKLFARFLSLTLLMLDPH